MSLRDFLINIDEEIETVFSTDFDIEITETNSVPTFDDSLITFDNLDEQVKRCKILESCVLYIDIRNSSSISVSKNPTTLARIYSTFVRSMIASAGYYNGYVRNIIGDRVMVVFDNKDCFTNAVNTAILMNTVSKHLINKHVSNIDFKCGIGIDYGKMLIVKAGAVKRGAETEFYRSLVWLGRPANVASKLTDLANKKKVTFSDGICEGYYYSALKEWGWYDITVEQFIDKLETTSSQYIKHKERAYPGFCVNGFSGLQSRHSFFKHYGELV